MQSIKVNVYSDIACPWCRVGRHSFTQAARQLSGDIDIELRHLPFQLNPNESVEPVPLPEMMSAKYGAEGTQAMFTEMRDVGERLGLEFNLERGIAVNTFTAHRMLWFADRKYGNNAQHALTDLLFTAYFQNGGNVGDHAQLADMAEQAGMDRSTTLEFLASDEGTDKVRKQLAEGRARGIRSVPTFVVADGLVISGAKPAAEFVEALRSSCGAAGAASAAGSCPVA